jgi:CRP/FNR family cyclic AMP-dependent transcriptional regulator
MMGLHAALRELPLFAYLSTSEIDMVTPLARLLEGEAGVTLLKEGEPVQNIYFLLSGEAEVAKQDRRGHRQVIATVGKGALLGEMALVEDAPASATVVATRDFKAVAFDRQAFNLLLEGCPGLGWKILKQIARLLSQRLRTTSAQLADHKAAS